MVSVSERVGETSIHWRCLPPYLFGDACHRINCLIGDACRRICLVMLATILFGDACRLICLGDVCHLYLRNRCSLVTPTMCRYSLCMRAWGDVVFEEMFSDLGYCYRCAMRLYIPGRSVGRNIKNQIRHTRIWLSRLNTPNSPLGPPEQWFPTPLYSFFTSRFQVFSIFGRKWMESIPSAYSEILRI